MSGYSDLRDLGVRFVPPDGPLPPSRGRTPLFSASWSSTVELLARELEALDAKGIAIELDMPARAFRQDGLPRADARALSDSVRISFSSKHGPLRYETGEYGRSPYYRSDLDGWQNNLRAIALSLEALRAVDRYGVSRRGEQYRGWRALPMGSVDPVDLISTPEAAVEAILAETGDLYDRGDLADDGPHLADAIRNAIRRSHPDAGGDDLRFRKVMKAKEVLGV